MLGMKSIVLLIVVMCVGYLSRELMQLESYAPYQQQQHLPTTILTTTTTTSFYPPTYPITHSPLHQKPKILWRKYHPSNQPLQHRASEVETMTRYSVRFTEAMLCLWWKTISNVRMHETPARECCSKALYFICGRIFSKITTNTKATTKSLFLSLDVAQRCLITRRWAEWVLTSSRFLPEKIVPS